MTEGRETPIICPRLETMLEAAQRASVEDLKKVFQKAKVSLVDGKEVEVLKLIEGSWDYLHVALSHGGQRRANAGVDREGNVYVPESYFGLGKYKFDRKLTSQLESLNKLFEIL